MKKEIQKELEEIAPFLATLKEQSEGYTVPKHFFNNMRIDIMNKVSAEELPIILDKPKLSQWQMFLVEIQSLFQPKIAIGFATLLLAFVGIFYFFKPNDTVENAIEIATSGEKIEIKNVDKPVVKEKEILNADKKQESTEKFENIAQSSIKDEATITKVEQIPVLRLEDASEEELNALFDELVENEDLSEEELSEEIQ